MENHINVGEIINNFFIGFMENEKRNKVNNFKILNKSVIKGQTLFAGSSLMEFFPIYEMKYKMGKDIIIYNRGVGGFTTTDLINNLDTCIFDLEPARIFINIGTNDIGFGDYSEEELIYNYRYILEEIKLKLPETEVFVMAYYPVNAKADFPGVDKSRKKDMFATRTNEAIDNANKAVEKLASEMGYNFIDVNEGLKDQEGNLKEEYAIEGLHMWASGYEVVLENLKKYL